MVIEYEPKIPIAFEGIFSPFRYKVFHGGRGGAKSETVARYLLKEGMDQPMTILCAREYQSSIKDSVHQLLSNVIREHKIEHNPKTGEGFYQILQTEIRGINGTKFLFAGLHHNIANIKSIPNIRKCWVEEAETVSDNSWSVLIPTIRADDSEIIITFNPDLTSAPTYSRFIEDKPKNSLVVKVGWQDNPYFPSVLKEEKDDLKEKNYEDYLNIWEGEPRKSVKGAIFANQIFKATEEGRINDDVEYNNSVPVHTYWDLGKANKTAVWFAQYVGMQWRILRCIVGFGKDLEDYIEEIQSLPYGYGTHYLPHDARQDRLGMQRSVEDQVRLALGNVEIVERVTHKINAIEAAKEIMGICHFHKTDCADGLFSMERYAYKVQEDGRVSQEPDHQYSDAPDAFMTFAMSAQPDLIDDDRPSYSSPSPRLG